MGLIIQKFGGTSVADVAKIKAVVKIIQAEINRNNQVVIVVSAMAGVTNQLVSLCSEMSSLDNDLQMMEYDAALTTGEVVSSALLALALQKENIAARSVQAWQLPITTDAKYGKALVEEINISLIKQCLSNFIIPVISGFQGISRDNRLTSLGRGGSDTTAALIAAACNADRCDIYTDVEGVFSADPRMVNQAKKIDYLSYGEMLAMSYSGAKVLHPRCVEIAMRYNVPLKVLSSFKDGNGTLIINKKDDMEHGIITAIAVDKNLLKINVQSGYLSYSKFYIYLVENGVDILHLVNSANNDQFEFIVPLIDRSKLKLLLEKLQNNKDIKDFKFDDEISAISIIGHCIRNDSDILLSVLRSIDQIDTTILKLTCFETKIEIFTCDQHVEKLVRILHHLRH